jgi:hypothetical protein
MRSGAASRELGEQKPVGPRPELHDGRHSVCVQRPGDRRCDADFRDTGDDDYELVIVNRSNRKVAVTVDLISADFMPAKDLLSGKNVRTAFSPGLISFPTPMGAFEVMALKRSPRTLLSHPVLAMQMSHGEQDYESEKQP